MRATEVSPCRRVISVASTAAILPIRIASDSAMVKPPSQAAAKAKISRFASSSSTKTSFAFSSLRLASGIPVGNGILRSIFACFAKAAAVCHADNLRHAIFQKRSLDATICPQPFIMSRPNDKARVIEHYDLVSPYYRSLWGEHLHHGYWINGDESKERAQVQLVEHLAELTNIKPGSEILDIGCGFGASSLYLAKKYQAPVTGITISSVQVEMATMAAANKNLPATFLLMDAEALTFCKQFDVLWSIESISHYQDRCAFFASAARLLKPGGSFAMTDWFKRADLTPAEQQEFIDPIEQGMLVELKTMDEYERMLTSNGLQIRHSEILNKNTAKTWDISLEIIKDKNFWSLAAQHGSQFVTYLKAFQAMRAGFASGKFVYGLFVASSDSCETESRPETQSETLRAPTSLF